MDPHNYSLLLTSDLDALLPFSFLLMLIIKAHDIRWHCAAKTLPSNHEATADQYFIQTSGSQLAQSQNPFLLIPQNKNSPFSLSMSSQ